MGASAMAMIGDEERSAYCAARAVAVHPEGPLALYYVAGAYGILRQNKEYLDGLERAVAQGWGDKACWSMAAIWMPFEKSRGTWRWLEQFDVRKFLVEIAY